MSQPAPQLKIQLAINPVDFRNGVDGLAALCQKVLAADPFSGTLFVFRNRRGTALIVAHSPEIAEIANRVFRFNKPDEANGTEVTSVPKGFSPRSVDIALAGGRWQRRSGSSTRTRSA